MGGASRAEFFEGGAGELFEFNAAILAANPLLTGFLLWKLLGRGGEETLVSGSGLEIFSGVDCVTEGWGTTGDNSDAEGDWIGGVTVGRFWADGVWSFVDGGKECFREWTGAIASTIGKASDSEWRWLISSVVSELWKLLGSDFPGWTLLT
jgi:hypothetical protein